MKKHDNFNEWIRRQVEDNPQEPPESSWEQISESLDLETAWQGIHQDLEIDNLWTAIDGRLQLHEHMRWWERFGAACAALMVVLAISLPLIWQELENNPLVAEQATIGAPLAGAPVDAVGQQSGDIFSKSASSAIILPGDEGKVEAVAQEKKGGVMISTTEKAEGQPKLSGAKTKAVPEAKPVHAWSGIGGGQLQPAPTTRNSMGSSNHLSNEISQKVSGASEEGNMMPVDAHYPVNGVQPDVLGGETVVIKAPELVAEEENTIVPDKSAPASMQYWRLGFSMSGRMSTLLNQKTFRAMERSTLSTPLPTYGKSFAIQAEKGITPRLALFSDLVLYSEAGQRYQEYREGVYGTTETEFIYSHLSLITAYSPAGRGFLQRPFQRWLAGFSGGWLHRAQHSDPFGTADISREYKPFTAAFVLGWEMNYPLTRRLWTNYGVRGQVDLFNIYAGDGLVPANFRLTRGAFLDFTIGLKYDLRKK